MTSPLPRVRLAAGALLAIAATAADSQPANAPAAPPADAATYTLAPGSFVSARVAFFGIASKTAGFPSVKGNATLNPVRPEAIDLDVTIDARALTAPDAITRQRLMSPAFFDVARYPFITFRGTRMVPTGERTANVLGAITARGISRPAILRVTFDEPPRSLARRTPVSLTATTVIDRRAFGMTAWRLIVGRRVTITLRARLQPD